MAGPLVENVAQEYKKTGGCQGVFAESAIGQVGDLCRSRPAKWQWQGAEAQRFLGTSLIFVHFVCFCRAAVRWLLIATLWGWLGSAVVIVFVLFLLTAVDRAPDGKKNCIFLNKSSVFCRQGGGCAVSQGNFLNLLVII